MYENQEKEVMSQSQPKHAYYSLLEKCSSRKTTLALSLAISAEREGFVSRKVGRTVIESTSGLDLDSLWFQEVERHLTEGEGLQVDQCTQDKAAVNLW